MIPLPKETNQTNGFTLRLQPIVMLDVSHVVGRTTPRGLRSAAGVVTIDDVFNFTSSLRHAGRPGRYIANERGEITVKITSWDNARLAEFLDLIVQGKISGVTADQREIESLRIMSFTLRSINHEQYS